MARRSLYQHFGGKDELIAASLLESAHQDEERYRAALGSGGSNPRQRVLAVFDQLDKTTSTPGFRGCRYVAAELCLTDPGHPAHQVTRAYTERLHALFEKELADLWALRSRCRSRTGTRAHRRGARAGGPLPAWFAPPHGRFVLWSSSSWTMLSL